MDSHINKANWAILFSLALLVLFLDYSGLDMALQKFFYDYEAAKFIGRDQFFFDQILHRGIKNLMYFLGVLSILLGAWAAKKKLITVGEVMVGIWGVLLIPLIVAFIKWFTEKQCPWSLTDFGGIEQHKHFWDFSLNHTIGQCFPAGHAAGGFMWLAWAVALSKSYPRVSNGFFYFGLLTGFLMGFSRMMQGAHFLSHVLATLAFVYIYVMVARYFLNKTEKWRLYER